MKKRFHKFFINWSVNEFSLKTTHNHVPSIKIWTLCFFETKKEKEKIAKGTGTSKKRNSSIS